MKGDDTNADDNNNNIIKNGNNGNNVDDAKDDDDIDIDNDEKRQRSSSSSSSSSADIIVTDINDNDINDNDKLNFSPTHMDDDEFQIWFYKQLINECSQQLVQRYNQLMIRISYCVLKWRIRYRGNKGLWKRIFKKQRVIKEIIESIPIISAVEQWVLAYDIMGAGGEEEVSVSSSSSTTTTTKDNNENNKNDININNKKITIIDLCSGKGYLSMVLSELLPTSKVEKFWLVDKQWPLCYSKLQKHHISWEHIYGDTNNPLEDPEKNPDYYETWPIPLVTSKQDLKQSSILKKFALRLLRVTPSHGPILVLAVHLCGTLSIQAIKLIHEINNNNNNNNVDNDENENENKINKINKKARVLILKPCCLPPIYHITHTQCFEIGPYYKFNCKDVCAGGKWNSSSSNKNKNNTTSSSSNWNGPPRCHLYNRFQKWCYHLKEGTESSLLLLPQQQQKEVGVVDESEEKNNEDYLNTTTTTTTTNMEAGSGGRRRHGNCAGGKVEIQNFPIQTKGGYQNSFIFAEITAATTTTKGSVVASAATAAGGAQEESKHNQNEEVEGGVGVGSSSSSSSQLTSQFWDDIHLLNDMENKHNNNNKKTLTQHL